MLIFIKEESPILITLVIIVGEKAWEERRKTVLWERERERIGNEYGRKEQRNGTIRHNEGREY